MLQNQSKSRNNQLKNQRRFNKKERKHNRIKRTNEFVKQMVRILPHQIDERLENDVNMILIETIKQWIFSNYQIAFDDWIMLIKILLNLIFYLNQYIKELIVEEFIPSLDRYLHFYFNPSGLHHLFVN